jgi:uncharacterized membrane protein
MQQVIEAIGLVIDIVGVGVIVVGAVGATVGFGLRLRSGPLADAYALYRVALGRAILLGLEFLVAGDIIRTVAIRPSFESVGVLGLIVLVRTFLSFALEVEIEGRWPWERGERRKAERPS